MLGSRIGAESCPRIVPSEDKQLIIHSGTKKTLSVKVENLAVNIKKNVKKSGILRF